MLEWVETNVNHHTLYFPENNSLQQLFNHVVNEKKDEIALKMNGQSMTYDELNHYANRIANELMKMEDIWRASCIISR